MELHEIDPVDDPRWSEFLKRHPCASVFHTPGWLEALRRTYGYEPVAFTSSAPGEKIHNGLVFCRVSSWLTGRRMVSLPFSDHCDPLFDSPEELEVFIGILQAKLKPENLKYVELRPINGRFDRSGERSGFRPARRYRLHRLDLIPNLDEIRQGFHKDSILRRIRRAERAGLVEKCGRSEGLLKDFYDLLVITRARHYLPAQPYKWFENLISCLGNALEIRVAYKEQTPAAAILTLRFRDVVYYKYGCSDLQHKHLGAMPLVLWRAIEEAKSTRAQEFNLGRSDEDNLGLIAFKGHWTEHASTLVYWRFPGPPSIDSGEGWTSGIAKRIFSIMPKDMLTLTGAWIYRHIG